MFAIDEQTIAYLRLTGREPEQVQLVETYARHAGLWADSLASVQYERCLQFDLSSVTRSIAGPSNPHARVATSELSAKGIAGPWTQTEGQMPDGAVIIAAITSCTNTSNPRNVIAAGLLARNARNLGLTRKPWVKTSLAPGSKTVPLYLQQAGLMQDLQALGFGVVAFACTTCNGMSGPWSRRWSKRSGRATCTPQPSFPATAISMDASIRWSNRLSWPHRRWWWPMR